MTRTPPETVTPKARPPALTSRRSLPESDAPLDGAAGAGANQPYRVGGEAEPCLAGPEPAGCASTLALPPCQIGVPGTVLASAQVRAARADKTRRHVCRRGQQYA